MQKILGITLGITFPTKPSKPLKIGLFGRPHPTNLQKSKLIQSTLMYYLFFLTKSLLIVAAKINDNAIIPKPPENPPNDESMAPLNMNFIPIQNKHREATPSKKARYILSFLLIWDTIAFSIDNLLLHTVSFPIQVILARLLNSLHLKHHLDFFTYWLTSRVERDDPSRTRRYVKQRSDLPSKCQRQTYLS